MATAGPKARSSAAARVEPSPRPTIRTYQREEVNVDSMLDALGHRFDRSSSREKRQRTLWCDCVAVVGTLVLVTLMTLLRWSSASFWSDYLW